MRNDLLIIGLILFTIVRAVDNSRAHLKPKQGPTLIINHYSPPTIHSQLKGHSQGGGHHIWIVLFQASGWPGCAIPAPARSGVFSFLWLSGVWGKVWLVLSGLSGPSNYFMQGNNHCSQVLLLWRLFTWFHSSTVVPAYNQNFPEDLRVSPP